MQNVSQGNGKVAPKVDNSSSKVNAVKRGSESTSTPNTNPTQSETGTYSEHHKRFMTDTSESEEESVSEVASFLIDQDFEEDPQVEAAKFLLSHQGDRVDPETQERLEALLRAAGIGQLATKDGKHLADPEVLRRLTSSVSCALDEAAAALTRMRSDNTARPLSEKTSLVEACTDGDVSAVRKLLTEGRSIQETSEEGESLLSLACSAGYFELAQQVLLAMHANIEDRGIKGECTPLMEAASAGHIDIVRLLVAHGAEINAHSTSGNTPLMYGCAGGHVDVVRFLLEQGASLEEHNENGHTPLMEAASAGHVEVAKILLEHGAGINTHSNEFKESALTLACYKGHLAMVKFLLEAGADQEHKTDEMHTALMEASMDGHVEVARLLLDSGAQVNMPTDSFESPLTLAACGGHVDLAMLLLERGANIEEVNDEGYTPLMEAAREGHEEMVALLLSQGANINAQTDETQETALTLACCGGFTEVADFLLKAGADIELGASTPLMEAAQEGHLELVKYLLENNANVHAQTQTGDTALTYACENGHTDVADLLLQYGADMEHESEGGRTPLMKACRAGHLCTVQFLISKGADVRRPTSNNDHTPISLACAGGHLSVVELLLSHGADPNHKLKDNSSTLIEAAKGGHTAVVQLLLDYPHSMMLNQQPTTASNLSILPGQVASRDSPLSSALPQPVSFFQPPNVPPTVLQEVPEAVRIVTQDEAQQAQGIDVTKQPMTAASDSTSRLSEGQQQNAASQQQCKSQQASGGYGNNHQLSKSRSAGAVFDTGLTSAEAQQVRTQPIAELEVNDVFATSHTVHFLAREEDEKLIADDGDQKKQQILEELHKVDRDFNAKQGHNHMMLPFAVPQEQCQSAAANTSLPHALNIDMAMQQPQGLGGGMAAPMFSSGNMSHMSVHNAFYSGPSCLQSPGVPLKLAVSGDSGTSFAPPNQGPPTFYFAPLNGSVAVPLSTATTSVSTQPVKVPTVTTHTEVSQNTAISDRPKAKPVSKKEGKNVRKQPYQTNFCNPPQPLLFSQPMTQQQSGATQQQQQPAANQQALLPEKSLTIVDTLNVQTLELDTLEQDAFDVKDDSQPDSLLTASILQQFHNNSQIRAAFVGSPVQSYPTTIDETIIAGLSTQQQDLPTQSDISRVEYFAVPTGNANPLQVQHTLYPYEHYLQDLGIGTVGAISNKEQSGAIYQAGFQAGINLMQQQLACPNATSSETSSTTVIPATLVPATAAQQFTAATPLPTSCAHAIPTQPMQSHLCQMPCNQHHPNMVPTHHHLVPTHQQQPGQQANQVQAATQTSQSVSNDAKRPAKSIAQDAAGGKKKGKVLYRHQSQQGQPGNQFQQGQGGQVDPNAAVTQYAGTPSQDCSNMAVAIAPPGYRMEIDAETESNHDTALTLACAGGHDELVQLLLQRGAQIEHRDKKGFTPLILAATAGHEKTVETLLNSDADIEAQSERTKDTPLSLACSGGRYEVVELLLMRNANKEHRNVSDYTPLSLAASGGYVNIIKLLLSHGAEINSRTGSKLGISPLMLAAMNGHTSAVKLLLDMGSDINAQIETNRNTALTLACFQGRHEVVSLLLDRKANVEHRAKTGLTPLMEAASGGYVEVGRVLLDKGADVNATPVPSSRDTALTIAADKGHVRFVELLLCRGAAVEVKNKKGNSPLWLAANGGHLSVVELLYNLSADIDSQDNRKVSCLMAAFRKGHVKVVKWMVNHVTQFPSDQEMVRYIGTVSDKELLDKCNECIKVIRAAKDTQAAKANKNASNLLEEISMEKTREESKKAAAARKRERKKKKKLEKKVEKLKLTEENKKNENYDDKDDPKEDEKEEDEPQEPASTSPLRNGDNPDKEEGDSGIDANSQGSCSSNEVKPKEKRKDKKKKKNSSKSELRNSRNSAASLKNQESKDDKKSDKDRKAPSPRKNLVFEATKHPAERDDFEATGNETYFSSPKVKKLPDVYESVSSRGNAQTSPKQAGKREEGWKEVVTRKSSTQPVTSETVGVKKVSVPLNAISRVIGRGGCNINAIRGATGAYIEVEKQSKGQGERTITIKGTTDVVKKAHSFIHMLVKDNEIDILQLLPKATKAIGGVPSTTTLWDKTQLATKKTAGKVTAAPTVSTTTTTLLKPVVVVPSSSASTVRLVKRTPPAAFTPLPRPSAPPRLVAQAEKNIPMMASKLAALLPTTVASMSRPISKPITTVASQTFAAKLTESTAHPLNVTVSQGATVAKPRMSQSLNVSQSSIGPVSPQAASSASSSSSANQMSPKHRRPSPTGSAPPNMQHFPSPGKLPFPNATQAVAPSSEQIKRSSTPIPSTVNSNLLEDSGTSLQMATTSVTVANPTPPQYSLFNPVPQQSVFQQSVLRRESEQKNFAAVTGGGGANQTAAVAQTFIDDETPTVDAAKAPGYRGTTVSSPVSSKASSNSTTPPNLSLPSSNSGYQQPLPIGSNIMHNRPVSQSNQNDLANSYYPTSEMPMRPMQQMTHSDTNLYKSPRSKMIMNFQQQPQMAASQNNLAPQPGMSRLNPKAADFSTSGQSRFSMDYINSSSSFNQNSIQQPQYGKHMINYSRSPSAPVPSRWHHVMQQGPYNQQTKMSQPTDLIGLPMSIQSLARATGGDMMENGEYGGMMTSPTMSPNLPAPHMTTVDGPHDERKPAGSVPPPIGTERARKSYQQTPLISDHNWPNVEPKMYMERSWPNSANMDRYTQMQKPMYGDPMPPVMDNYQGMPMDNSFGYANGTQMHFLHQQQQQMMNLRGNEYASNDQLKMASGMTWDQPNMADMQDKAQGWSGMMPKWTNP